MQTLRAYDSASPATKDPITVVPDSGTGELRGLSGRLDIRIVDGEHFYTFDYTLFDDTSASA